MRKKHFFIIAPLLLFLSAHLSSQSSQYFESDSFGNLFAELAKADTPSDNYWISLEKHENIIIQKLYKKNLLISIMKSVLNPDDLSRMETESINGIITAERKYDRDLKIETERSFNSDGTVSETFYKYSNGNLIQKTVNNGTGETSTITYIYNFDGRLLEARESGSFASGAGPVYLNETKAWIKNPEGIVVTKYNSNGEPLTIERFIKNDLETVEDFIYEGKSLIQKKTSFKKSAKTIEVLFNKNSLPEIEITYIKNKQTEKTVFEYDENLYLIKKTTIGNGISNIIEYSKNESSKTEYEKHYLNGIITMVIIRESRENYSIETYDSGILMITTFFLDGRKSKEQFWKNGAIIKERSFP